MSCRRAPLIAIKAKARLDWLARVISAAPSLAFIPSISNPVLLCDSPAFALPEKNHPGSKEPTGDEGAQENEDRPPNYHSGCPIGDGTAHRGVNYENKEKVQRANQTKPPDTPKSAPSLKRNPFNQARHTVIR